ncbi:hypothetical protein QTP86_013260 [Hemibagrus guttatus]|nr:hypothetical protein QTP86_013260 [Hemibagrus guttatus]
MEKRKQQKSEEGVKLRWRLFPRVLRDVSNVDMSTTVLGQSVSMPVCVAATAMQRMAHPEGETATARGMMLSSWATSTIEEVAQAAPAGLRWMQLYIYKDRALTQSLVRRAEEAGYKGIFVTVDTPYLGKRRDDVRNRFKLPSHLRMANFETPDLAFSSKEGYGEDSGLAVYVAQAIDPTLKWEDIAWLKRITSLPLVVKGVLRDLAGSGTKITLEMEFEGYDVEIEKIDALPEIVEAVGGRAEVYLDGGVRTGTDVLKALALGARAVFVGRPILWGLACEGEKGVHDVLQVLREELHLALALTARRMDPNTSASSGAPSQNTSPIMDPAELRDIIVRQGAIIRSYQDQVESTGSARSSRALEWASVVWDADPQIRSSFSHFAGLIREVFEYPAGGKDISVQLMELRQGTDTAADYAIMFRTLAAQSGWNDASLWAVFHAGLNPELQTELACRAEATTLSQFVATAIRLDNLRRQHQAGASGAGPVRHRSQTDYPSFREEAPEPMQLGRSRLADPTHSQQGWMRLCYHCGASGHQSSRCPERVTPAKVGGSSQFFSMLVPVSLSVSDRCISVSALIDSGAAVNLIDGALVERLGIPTFPCVPSLRITAIDIQPIEEGYLKRQTELLEFRVGLFHQERLAFYITSSPANPVILGFPWLRRHDPQISWCSGELVRWSPSCHYRERIYPLSLPESKAMEEYIETALAAGHIQPSTSPVAAGFFFVGKTDGGLRPCIDYRGLNAITVPYPYPLPLVPAAQEQLRGVRIFTKLDLRSAYNLVRIREGDEWKTAFHTTHGHYEYRVMPFSLTNAPAVFQALINGVFQDLLGKGVIAYIDDILVYSKSLEEHVLHIREVLSRLQRHHLYVKLEKCEFHRTMVTFLGYVISQRGVEMDMVKVRAVIDWPAPTTVRELQRFLGFTNFYRRLIRNYSSVADLPFVVEVDASSKGLGAVLSQRHGKPGKLHPCAYYSQKLTAAECNYDVGNRELLAIKAALEEWHHWLEGARHPFQVLTDHRNLEYLHGAKRLNPRQARWALFFTRFRFTVTYRPGSKNGKADALSRGFETTSESTRIKPILPVTAILAPVRWNLMEEIQRAHANEPPPAGCPPN